MDIIESLISNAKDNFISKDISIISQNCIGGVVYHDLGLEFLSPTINLYFDSSDFIKFISNLQYYLNLELKIIEKTPVITGILDDIKIYFLHYETAEIAEEKWNKRKAKILYDKIFVICTDRDGFNNEDFYKFKDIPYNKALITSNEKWKDYPFVIYLPQYKDQNCVPNTIPSREFYGDGKLIELMNKT